MPPGRPTPPRRPRGSRREPLGDARRRPREFQAGTEGPPEERRTASMGGPPTAPDGPKEALRRPQKIPRRSPKTAQEGPKGPLEPRRSHRRRRDGA
eukprot:3684886-Pyramimonas_sp.AAC.1